MWYIYFQFCKGQSFQCLRGSSFHILASICCYCFFRGCRFDCSERELAVLLFCVSPEASELTSLFVVDWPSRFHLLRTTCSFHLYIHWLGGWISCWFLILSIFWIAVLGKTYSFSRVGQQRCGWRKCDIYTVDFPILRRQWNCTTTVKEQQLQSHISKLASLTAKVSPISTGRLFYLINFSFAL